MGIKYEDTSHKTLGLAISEKDLDVTDLAILKTKKIGNIEIGILGASHYFKYDNGWNKFTEIFACRRLEGEMTYYPIDELIKEDEKVFELENFDYYFECSVMTDTKEIINLISLFEEDLTNKECHVIKVDFPTLDEPIFKACTYVRLVERFDVNYLITLHSYPEEGTAVYTKTRLKLKIY
jgi:hypothetical protein